MYEKEVAPCGVAIEEIYGADEKSAKVWKLFAMQIFSEADGDYRSMSHFANGAPYLDGIPQRISVSHTSHCLVVASIPKTPDIDLSIVNVRTALGIDIEKRSRPQVLKVRDRFLNDEELGFLPSIEDVEKASEEDIERYILAWTCKEAMFKAIMGGGSDWKNDYRILSLPLIAEDMSKATPDKYGKATVLLNGATPQEMELLLSSWRFEGHVVSLAFSSKIARYAIGC